MMDEDGINVFYVRSREEEEEEDILIYLYYTIYIY